MGSLRDLQAGLPVLTFEDSRQWTTWLRAYHATSPGVWLRLAKKGSGVRSVSYEEALEAALRYGWIDGQKKSADAASWLQRFAPRGPRSIWSKRNREKAEELIRGGRMRAAGLVAVEAARRDGRWDAAYDPQARAAVPPDLARELAKRPRAKAFFQRLDSHNRYAILHRLQTATRPETRTRRLQRFVEMLERGETIYPTKAGTGAAP